MAPRKPKPLDDDASSTTSELPPVLKPKNEKAKVTKPKPERAKSDKPKVDKPKTEKPKTDKPKAVKKEKVEDTSGSGGGKTGKGGDSGDKSGGAKNDGGKEKVKPVNGEEAVELMAKYLRDQNRPYSATEVSANLHGKVCSPSPILDGLGNLLRGET